MLEKGRHKYQFASMAILIKRNLIFHLKGRVHYANGYLYKNNSDLVMYMKLE